jgi:hypothetical protein
LQSTTELLALSFASPGPQVLELRIIKHGIFVRIFTDRRSSYPSVYEISVCNHNCHTIELSEKSSKTEYIYPLFCISFSAIIR